jgi:hypothetical protein
MRASEIMEATPTRFVSGLPDTSDETVEFLRLFEGHFEVHGVLDSESDSDDPIFYQYKVSKELLDFMQSEDGIAMRKFLQQSKD